MQTADPKKDQSNAMGGAKLASAHPLEQYSASPQQPGVDQGEKSPYYKSNAPSIALPKGGGAIKGIDEKFTVNAVNGTAALTVGLPLSPGRNGFTPALSLQYNSGSGNTEFGLGFSLSLPSIQRKTDKKLPTYNDATESDVFLMGGAEDLQPLLIESGGGWVADVFTDGDYHIKRYRPRTEGLFARTEYIKQTGVTGGWWKVTTKDNVVTFYGLSPDARVADPVDAGRIFKWLPELCFDNKGNVQQYYYVKDTHPGSIPRALHEKNRRSGLAQYTNTYLKSVAYCNNNSYLPDSNYKPRLTYRAEGDSEEASSSGDKFSADYMMQLVFDYGSHDTDWPMPYEPIDTWTARKDPFSDFHSGFEIRTYRKCRRVMMFHYFPEVVLIPPFDVPEPPNRDSRLIRSIDFTYMHDDSAADLVDADFITAVTEKGYKKATASSNYVKAMPPLTFEYQLPEWNKSIIKVAREDYENAPQGLTGQYHWIDLWGEGLPGILSEQANGWFYKRNLGDAHFTAAASIATHPSVMGLGSALQWQDLDGDGRRQLVSNSPAMPGYFELDDDQKWHPFRTFKEMAFIDWSSPFTRVLDLNGDGRPDLLITEENIMRWYENAGTDGYTEGGLAASVYDEEKGPRLLHNDEVQSIFLADMNGDGLTDIVRIKNGEVCYWPNMGYGKFGAKVMMSNAPHFDTPDQFNPQYLTLADITGTGAPDIVYIRGNKCTAWTNLAGNALSDGDDIVLPPMDQQSKITVIDFLGNGTGCLVWSSPLPSNVEAPMRYIDLMGGTKPYLLRSYQNGRGKRIQINYRSSTAFYLDDKANGMEWATRLPFPVHCVHVYDIQDEVSSTGYKQIFRYHHGYYDHAEREFRGFGRVDVWDADTAMYYDAEIGSSASLNQAAILTRTWYHTGAWMRRQTLLEAFEMEYHSLGDWTGLPAGVELPPDLTPQESREAHRALKGQPLRQEVYMADGAAPNGEPYSISVFSYCVRMVQPLQNNRFASFYSYRQHAISLNCEQNVADARVMHELTIAVDEYGNVTEAAKIAYPRASRFLTDVPAIDYMQKSLLITYSRNAFTNNVISGAYRLRMPSDAQVWQLTGVPSETFWRCADLKAAFDGAIEITFTETFGGGPQRRMISNERTLYWSDDATTVLGLGTVESLALPARSFMLAYTEEILKVTVGCASSVTSTLLEDAVLEGGYMRESDLPGFGSKPTNFWLPGELLTYDEEAFYMPVAFTDPWGNSTSVSYGYNLVPTQVTDALGNVANAAYDFYCLRPAVVVDINSNETHILYDELGIAVAVAQKEKDGSTIGDSLAGIDPSTDGAAQAAFFDDPLTMADTLISDASWRCVYKLEAPFTIAMIARQRHALGGDGVAGNLLRFFYFDGLGRAAMHKAQAAPSEGKTDIRWTASGKTVYNNKGSVVMQYEPYFSATHAYDYTEQAEEASITPRLHYDALGRVFRTNLPDGTYTKTEWTPWRQAIYDNNDTVTDSEWYALATAGSEEEIDAAAKAAKHYNTPTILHLDTLGRPGYTTQHDCFPDSEGMWNDNYYNSYVILDIAGNRLEVHDARGLKPFVYTYNMVNAVIKQVSLGSGIQHTITDVGGQPLYGCDSLANIFHYTYDALRRKLTKEVIPDGGSLKVLEKYYWGDTSTPSPEVGNYRGRIIGIYDGAGYVKYGAGYDFKGNPLHTSREYTTAYDSHPDWSASPALSGGVLDFFYKYDALGRPDTTTAPDGSDTTYAYDESGSLYTLHVINVGGSLTTDVINEIYYNAKGQRTKVKYENGATTKYTYDEKTFRVKRIRTTRASDSAVLQDMKYWYDPVGNITMYRDDAQQTVYFANSVMAAENKYLYDALYRLIQVRGREHRGDNLAVTAYDADRYFGDVPYSNDSGAVRAYTQYYTYDAVGNMVQMKHTTTGGTGNWTRDFTVDTTTNRLLASGIGSEGIGTETYSYDARGNLVRGFVHLDTVGETEDSLYYNAENRLEKVLVNSGTTAYYQYDSNGQRVRKTLVNPGSVLKVTRKYVGDWELYEERDLSLGTLMNARETLHVHDGETRVVTIDTSATDTVVRYQLSNHLGTSSTELGEEAEVITYEEYYPYGSTSFTTTASVMTSKRYRYIGKERDEETGLYYIGARYYCPWLARWCASDPINSEWYNLTHGAPTRNQERQFVELTASPYEYCYANPVRFSDPTGEQVPPQNNNLDRTVEEAKNAPKNAHKEITALKKDFEDGVEQKAINGMKFFAQKLMPGVDNLTEREKQNVFLKSTNGTISILLYEFATGTGPADGKREFNANHAITKSLMKMDATEKALDRFYEVNEGKSVGELQEVSYAYQMSPTKSPLSWPNFIKEHGKVLAEASKKDFLRVFTGGFVYKMTPNGSHIDIVMLDAKNRNSLFLHASGVWDKAKNVPRNQQTPEALTTTNQKYTSSVPIDSKRLESLWTKVTNFMR